MASALLALLLWLAAASPACLAEAPATQIRVAAASSLQFALETLSARFQRNTGFEVRVSLGASGNLVRQIQRGGPFDIFLSADRDHLGRLVDSGLTIGPIKDYAQGRLALFIPHDSPIQGANLLDSFQQMTLRGAIRRFAIANPSHAPYGLAARQALQEMGLWIHLQDRLVLGENAAQAARFAASGSAQAGIIPHSLALASGLSAHGQHVLLPRQWHEPLIHSMVLLPRARMAARQFFEFLLTSEGQTILQQHGFAPAVPR